MDSDGRIMEIKVVMTQKRYKPEPHYVFILRLKRENLNFYTYVFRKYKEFCELESKIGSYFPNANVHR